MRRSALRRAAQRHTSKRQTAQRRAAQRRAARRLAAQRRAAQRRAARQAAPQALRNPCGGPRNSGRPMDNTSRWLSQQANSNKNTIWQLHRQPDAAASSWQQDLTASPRVALDCQLFTVAAVRKQCKVLEPVRRKTFWWVWLAALLTWLAGLLEGRSPVAGLCCWLVPGEGEEGLVGWPGCGSIGETD